MRALAVWILLCLNTSGMVLALDGPWDGEWKLDVNHSELTGETFTYTRGERGTWSVSSGGPITIQFGTDGKPYRSFSDAETVSCTMEGPGRWTFRRQYNGVEWDVNREQLSPDEKTITSTEEVTIPDHQVSHVVTIFKRIGAGNGFEGRWMSSQIIGHYTGGWVYANRFQIKTTGSQTMQWTMPDDDMRIEGPMDGSAIQVGEPETKVAVQMHRVSEREIGMAIWRDGKEERDYRMVLDPNGKHFKCYSWAPGKRDETRTALYVKQ